MFNLVSPAVYASMRKVDDIIASDTSSKLQSAAERHYVMARRTDFLVQGAVRRRRDFEGLKTSSEEIGRNAHTHSFRFPRTRFFCLPAKRRPSKPQTRKSVRVGTARRVGLSISKLLQVDKR